MSALPVPAEIWPTKTATLDLCFCLAIVGLANQRVRIDIFHVS